MTAEVPHILVIDDDKRLRELLRKYLAEQGFRVTVAFSCNLLHEAMPVTRGHRFGLFTFFR